jgi:hypothetical protein
LQLAFAEVPYLSPPDALGLWFKTFEPHWASAVERISQNHHVSYGDKFLLAGYWAHLSTCTPTWQRVATQLQQSELDEKYLGRFIEHATDNPEQYPRAQEYLPLVKDGSLRATIDPDYPKGYSDNSTASASVVLIPPGMGCDLESYLRCP